MAVPVFVTVTLWVVVFPTPTVPKLTVVRLADSMPAPAPVAFTGGFAPVRPVQLESPRIAIMTASRITKASGPAGRLALERASSACDCIRSGWVGVCGFMMHTV